MSNPPYIDETAIIEPRVVVSSEVKIWAYSQVREGAYIGPGTNIGKGVYIGTGVKVGSKCKIQNNATVYHGVTLADKVFVGPHVCFTNDKTPRAENDCWELYKTFVEEGASIGAGAIILCGITIGRYALIGAGSVVTKDVDPFTVVVGNPAKHVGWVDASGKIIKSVCPSSYDSNFKSSITNEVKQKV